MRSPFGDGLASARIETLIRQRFAGGAIPAQPSTTESTPLSTP
jgi:hypothetical protein